MKVSGIIVAAGSGKRFGSEVPKQFITLGGRPVLAWSLEVFAESGFISELILVVPPQDHARATEIADKWAPPNIPIKVVPGGWTRQESVRLGLDAVDRGFEWIAVHDAARPFVTLSQIECVCLLAREVGAGILAIPVQDTIKEVDRDGLIVRGMDRTRLYLAQTPQVCRRKDLQSAYRSAGDIGIEATDEAGLLEASGIVVGVAEGNPGNFKITTQEDLKIAEALINRFSDI